MKVGGLHGRANEEADGSVTMGHVWRSVIVEEDSQT